MNFDITALLFLLIMFQLKHYLCDFPPKHYYKLIGCTGDDRYQLNSLSIHGLFHGTFTAVILIPASHLMGELSIIVPVALGILDGSIHFVVDRIVISSSLGTEFSLNNDRFRQVYGIDQFAHQTTYILVLFLFFASMT